MQLSVPTNTRHAKTGIPRVAKKKGGKEGKELLFPMGNNEGDGVREKEIIFLN